MPHTHTLTHTIHLSTSLSQLRQGPPLIPPTHPFILPPHSHSYNKVDICSIEEVDEMARMPNSIPISCSLQLNLDGLLVKVWEMLALVSNCKSRKGYLNVSKSI